MRLLLDTCSFLWALHSPSQLSAKARKQLQDPQNVVHASVISFWEISLKAGLGKLRLQGVTPEDYPTLARQSGWEILPLEPATAASSGRLPRPTDHRDPFDRMLVWTAIQHDLHFVSRDKRMASYTSHGLRLCW